MSVLETEVKELKQTVDKLKTLLAATGQQVLQLQMELRKTKIDDIDTKTKELQNLVPAAAGLKPSDIVTESDLNDMVMELQGQLNILDKRSIIRTLNSRSDDRLEPLPNADGETNPEFPRTISDLQSLSNDKLYDQFNFFEMLGETLADITDPKDEEGTKKVMLEIYDSFTKFIGVDSSTYPRLE